MAEIASPRVTIGVPVLNGEAHLATALESLLGQTFGDFELIISDNHSTDATETICRDYASRDRRIRFYRNDRNLGASSNFNRVFALARGRYFKWASANDVHAPEYLARCVEVLDRRPEVVLCYPKTALIDERGEMIRTFEDNLDLPWTEPKRRFREYLERVRLCNAVFGLIRPEVLRRTPRLGNYPGSDVVLMAELSLYGQFFEVPERLFFRRQERANVIRDQSVENWQEFFDPQTRGRLFLRTWRHQYEYVRAVLRAPLPFGERAQLLSYLGRLCVTHRGTLARELAAAVRTVAARGFARRPGTS
jgi:glycosyltransferase involved in cell wall biosynthesis